MTFNDVQVGTATSPYRVQPGESRCRQSWGRPPACQGSTQAGGLRHNSGIRQAGLRRCYAHYRSFFSVMTG